MTIDMVAALRALGVIPLIVIDDPKRAGDLARALMDGGLPFLKAIAAPYGPLEFIPTGGINAANLADYLGFDRVVACGGSWVAPQAWIEAGEFERIRQTTAEAVRIVHDAKGRA